MPVSRSEAAGTSSSVPPTSIIGGVLGLGLGASLISASVVPYVYAQ